ncbi:MAG: hypothetical protein HQL90_12955 [Magnetococcales bacterium]|nr:hypothetical protein [Magnetococcales bacterium]
MNRPILSLKRPRPGVQKLAPKSALIAPKPTKAPKPSRPEQLSKKARGIPSRKDIRAASLLDTLSMHHPHLFPMDGSPPRPWAIGIHLEVKAKYHESKTLCCHALRLWQRQYGHLYRAALRQGGARYNLLLDPVGEVTAAQQALAGGEIKQT